MTSYLAAVAALFVGALATMAGHSEYNPLLAAGAVILVLREHRDEFRARTEWLDDCCRRASQFFKDRER